MKKIEQPQLHDIKILKKKIRNFYVEFEKGDTVQIVGIGERGYDLIEASSGERITECGWDIFENE